MKWSFCFVFINKFWSESETLLSWKSYEKCSNCVYWREQDGIWHRQPQCSAKTCVINECKWNNQTNNNNNNNNNNNKKDPKCYSHVGVLMQVYSVCTYSAPAHPPSPPPQKDDLRAPVPWGYCKEEKATPAWTRIWTHNLLVASIVSRPLDCLAVARSNGMFNTWT